MKRRTSGRVPREAMASREQEANEGQKTRRTSVVPVVNESEVTARRGNNRRREQYSMTEVFNIRNYHENKR